MVSGADETTDVSLVGKFPGTAAPLALTPGADEAGGVVVVDETTDASSVGNFVGVLAAGDGELEGPAPSGPSLDVDATEGVLPFSAAAPFCWFKRSMVVC